MFEVGFVLFDGNVDLGGGSRSEKVVDVNQVVFNVGSGVIVGSETDSDVLSFILLALVGEVNERGGDVLQSGGVGVHLERCVDGIGIFICGGVAIGEDVGGVISTEFACTSGRVDGHVGDVPVSTTDTVEPVAVQGQGRVGTVAGVCVWVLAFSSISVYIVEGSVAVAVVSAIGVGTHGTVKSGFACR